MKNRVFAMPICLVLLLSMFSVTAMAAEVVDSGECGENLIWTLTADGTLTISGEGEMKHYLFDAPWEDLEVNTIVIEEGVSYIGARGFDGLSAVKITIPASVTDIDSAAFNGVAELEEIAVSEGNLHYINDENGVLYNKSKTKIIKVPSAYEGDFEIFNGINMVAEEAFVGCKNLTGITIPKTMINIGEGVFTYCANLDEFVVDKDNPNYCSDEHGVLFDKEMITLIQAPQKLDDGYSIPDSVINIGDYAFYNCDYLVEITIPNSVTSIGSKAFEYCSFLKKVKLSDNISVIEEYTFDFCESLTEITIPDGVTNIGESAFGYCRSLTEIIIPSSVTHIGEFAFDNCENLEKVTIHNGVKNIENFAFNGCYDLNEVTIPESVFWIGMKAFGSCGDLKLTFNGDAPIFGDDCFGADYEKSIATVFYPKNSENWERAINDKERIGCYAFEEYVVNDLLNENIESATAENDTQSNDINGKYILILSGFVLAGAGIVLYIVIKKRKQSNK